MSILNLLRSDGSIVVNKFLAREIGLNETVVLSELIARSEWHKEKGDDKNGWFYCTQKTLKKQTSLNRYYQDKSIDELIELGLISKKTMGIPAKRYFKINTKAVTTLVTSKIANNSQTSKRESNKLDGEDVANSNVRESQEVIQNYNTKDNNKNIRSGIVEIYEKVFCRLASDYQLEVLETFINDDQMKPEVIEYAIKYCGEKDGRSFAYLKKVLNSWASDGVKTVKDAKHAIKRFENRKDGNNDKSVSSSSRKSDKKQQEPILERR